jgi:DNA polymerase-1
MKQEGLKSRMVLQVHDELVFDVVPQELDRVMEIAKQQMESVCKLRVALIAECGSGKNWLEAH